MHAAGGGSCRCFESAAKQPDKRSTTLQKLSLRLHIRDILTFMPLLYVVQQPLLFIKAVNIDKKQQAYEPAFRTL
jgi:hypothetical protein